MGAVLNELFMGQEFISIFLRSQALQRLLELWTPSPSALRRAPRDLHANGQCPSMPRTPFSRTAPPVPYNPHPRNFLQYLIRLRKKAADAESRMHKGTVLATETV